MTTRSDPVDKFVRAALGTGNVGLKRVRTRIDYSRFAGGDTLATFDESVDENSFALVRTENGLVLCVIQEVSDDWCAQKVEGFVNGEMRLSCWIYRSGATLAEVIWKVLLCAAEEKLNSR